MTTSTAPAQPPAGSTVAYVDGYLQRLPLPLLTLTEMHREVARMRNVCAYAAPHTHPLDFEHLRELVAERTHRMRTLHRRAAA